MAVLARELEVAVRTVQRDITALRAAGLPVVATSGRTGGCTIRGGQRLRPIEFTLSEAAAVVTSIHAVGPVVSPAAEAVIAKVAAALDVAEPPLSTSRSEE